MSALPENFDPMKELLIDALCGHGVPLYKGPTCEKAGLAEYSGDQWNGGFVWKRDVLNTCTTEELETLYQGLKEEQYAC